VKRTLLLVATMLLLALAVQVESATAASATATGTRDQCQSPGSEDFLPFLQENDSIQTGFGVIGGPIEVSHGGPAPHCGDPCEVEGQVRGCIYYRFGVATRDQCICRNGNWYRSPGGVEC
jgi:hypothetical protein